MVKRLVRHWWVILFAGLSAIGATLWLDSTGHPPAVGATALPEEGAGAVPRKSAHVRVRVVKPEPGGLQRTTTQPGTVESFDYADLFAKVSGYLSRQDVDIGSRVTKGQVIAEISVPELNEALREAEAALAQAKAQVQQMEARIVTAQADYDAAMATIKRSEADLEHTRATRVFREKQYERIKNLFELKSIDERLVDEKEEQLEAARAAEAAAQAAILTAQAQAGAAKARIASAQADLVDSQAKVQVAEAAVSKAKVFVDYTRITSPYDGVVTRRNFHLGDFIRAADQGGHLALLTIARTDLMRVVVQVPERDVPYTNPGDKALVELDALAGRKFHMQVSRISHSEDRISRSMRTEIDIPNPDGELRDGMFGRMTIYLDHPRGALSIPSSCLVSDGDGKKVSVFIVREGKAHRVPVQVGHDDGVRVEILSGLQPDDRVIRRPGGEVADGIAVDADDSTESTRSHHERT